jgi:hypothetical protein
MAAAGSTNPPVRQQLRLPDLLKDVVSVSTFNRVPATHDAVSAALLADAPRTPGEVSRKLTWPRNSNVAVAPPIADYRGDHGSRTTGSAH